MLDVLQMGKSLIDSVSQSVSHKHSGVEDCSHAKTNPARMQNLSEYLSFTTLFVEQPQLDRFGKHTECF